MLEQENRNRLNLFKDRMLSKEGYYIKKYLLFLRKEEACRNSSNKILQTVSKIYERKKNRLGIRLGFVIPADTLADEVEICHIGNIIINGNARIGRGCKLHGLNCIGNDGKTQKAPCIGEYVDIGFGAIIIGDIKIADYCKIGAGAVITKSCLTPGTTLVGKAERNRWIK